MALILTVTMSASLVGCWDKKIYEETGFALQVGFETSNSGKILMSFTIPVLDPNAKEQTELIYNEANLLREFREMASRISPKIVEGGKIQQMLISDDLARKGVHSLLEVIEREATDPPIAYVLIVEGSTKTLLEATQNFGDKPALPSFYIHQLIESNIKTSYIPETRVFQFSSNYFSPGIDPIAPMIKLQYDKGKGIEVTGSALFAGDKMVGKIDTKQTSLLLAMMGKMKKMILVSKMQQGAEEENGKGGCAVTFSKVRRKLSVNIIDDKPSVDISLAFKATIDEFKWNKTYDENFQNKIEEILSAEIKKDCEQVLKYSQEAGSDPLGIGDIVRAKHDYYWEKVNWDSDYKNVNFNIKVKVNITNHGIIK